MPGVAEPPPGLTRQCSHSNDTPKLSPSSAPSTNKGFSFMRSTSFSLSKSRTISEPPTIPESEKEPIFDEIRDCDEAPYPQPPQPRKMSHPGSLDIKHKAEYKSFNSTGNNTNNHARSLSTSLPAVVPGSPSPSSSSASVPSPSNRSGTAPMPIPPHKKKWMNKLDPRFNAKLMEERQKTIERQERERRRKREDDQMIEQLLSKWTH